MGGGVGGGEVLSKGVLLLFVDVVDLPFNSWFPAGHQPQLEPQVMGSLPPYIP